MAAFAPTKFDAICRPRTKPAHKAFATIFWQMLLSVSGRGLAGLATCAMSSAMGALGIKAKHAQLKLGGAGSPCTIAV